MLGCLEACNWRPAEKRLPTAKQQQSLPAEQLSCYEMLSRHTEFHDEMYDEAGKLPMLSNLLVTALHLFVGGSGQKLIRVIPQARLGNYRTDYSITMVEIEGVSFCWIFTYYNIYCNITMAFLDRQPKAEALSAL